MSIVATLATIRMTQVTKISLIKSMFIGPTECNYKSGKELSLDFDERMSVYALVCATC